MHTAEIVVGEMQGDSGFQVRQFLAESIRQPRKPAKLHSEGEVLPLHKRSTDVLRIGIPTANLGYNLRDSALGVPLIPVLPVVSVELGQLSKVSVSREGFFDSLAVEDIGIRGQLNSVIRDTTAHVQHEVLSVLTGTLAHQKRRNQFGVCIKSYENPLVSKLCGMVLPNVPSLLRDERPNFIALDSTARQLAHPIIHDSFTTLPGHDEQTHDGVAIQSRKPLCAANRAVFKKALNSTHCRIGIRGHGGPRQFRVGFAESGTTGIAAPSLDAALTKVAELLADRVLVFTAGHDFSPLDLCGEKSQTLFGSGVRLTPRSGLAPLLCFRRKRGADVKA
jgi:hypothetical protein